MIATTVRIHLITGQEVEMQGPPVDLEPGGDPVEDVATKIGDWLARDESLVGTAMDDTKVVVPAASVAWIEIARAGR